MNKQNNTREHSNETGGVWDERTKTRIRPSGTVRQGRRPMFKPFDSEGRDQEFGPNWKQHFPLSQ